MALTSVRLRWSLGAALCLCVSAHAIEIPAGDTPVVLDTTTTTIAGWHADNHNSTSCDDQYGEGLERLSVSASRGAWALGLRLDGSLYYPRPVERAATVTAPGCNQVDLRMRYLNKVVPERLWGSYTGRTLEVTLGDSYVSFGRGLALSLRKNDELATDTALRGARVHLNFERVGATLVAGVTNIGNIDESSGRFAVDPLDVVLGAQVEGKVMEGVRVGAHAVGFAFHQPISTFSVTGDDAWKERWVNVGPTLDAPRLTSWLGLYLEGIWQRRQAADGEVQNGFGGYGAATMHFGDFTVLLEGKAYGDLAVLHPTFDALEFQPVQYSAPPTLERLLQPLEHPQRNVYGGRVRADWALTQDVSVFLGHGLFRDAEGYLDPDTAEQLAGTIYDPTAGADARFLGWRILGEAGWRFVVLPHTGATVRSDGHFEVTVEKEFGGPRSVELHAIDWERTKVLPFSTEVWREGSAQLGLRWRPFQVTPGLDWTSEPGQPKTLYPNIALQWDITRSTNLRAFLGSTRGGLRCVSGICRIFPPFEGGKVTFTARFYADVPTFTSRSAHSGVSRMLKMNCASSMRPMRPGRVVPTSPKTSLWLGASSVRPVVFSTT
jgi:hypothetical protein